MIMRPDAPLDVMKSECHFAHAHHSERLAESEDKQLKAYKVLKGQRQFPVAPASAISQQRANQWKLKP